MSTVFKAWGQEGTGPFTKWDVYRTVTLITFRQREYHRLIGIPANDTRLIEIHHNQVFKKPCPPEIVGKPKITIFNMTFGFENNGTEVLLGWLKS